MKDRRQDKADSCTKKEIATATGMRFLCKHAAVENAAKQWKPRNGAPIVLLVSLPFFPCDGGVLSCCCGAVFPALFLLSEIFPVSSQSNRGGQSNICALDYHALFLCVCFMLPVVTHQVLVSTVYLLPFMQLPSCVSVFEFSHWFSCHPLCSVFNCLLVASNESRLFLRSRGCCFKLRFGVSWCVRPRLRSVDFSPEIQK